MNQTPVIIGKVVQATYFVFLAKMKFGGRLWVASSVSSGTQAASTSLLHQISQGLRG